MNDPLYTYRRGHGWVPTYCSSLNARIGKYLITTEDRKPELGELFWSGNYARNLKAISTDSWWKSMLGRSHEEVLRQFTPYEGNVRYAEYHVVIVERVED
jgi:hypothetical protein